MADDQKRPIDYDALAKQHGAVESQRAPIDYDALAAQQGQVTAPAQAGPSDFQPMPTVPLPGTADITTPAGMGHFAIGIGRSVPGLVRGVDILGREVLGKISPQIAAAPQTQAERTIQQWATPVTPEEQIGKLTGNALQYLALPGGAGVLPAAGRIAGAGTLNLLQSDQPTLKDFLVGAGMGAGGEAIGMGLRRIAPGMAESAVGIGKGERTYGKTPGIAALEETRGISPTTVQQSARTRINQLNADIDNMAAQHPGTIDLRPAMHEINADIRTGLAQNNPTQVNQLREMRSRLTIDADTGQPIPKDAPATQALDLKRGLRKQYVSNWTRPDLMKGTRGTAAEASHAIDIELDQALGPEFARKNQTVSSLIPIEERAESASRGAGVPQNIMHRISAHTGALTPVVGGILRGAGGAAGAYGGYRERGLPGAVAGGMIGLVAPELISTPAARMAAARLFYSPVIPRLMTGAAGAGLQVPRAIDSGQ